MFRRKVDPTTYGWKQREQWTLIVTLSPRLASTRRGGAGTSVDMRGPQTYFDPVLRPMSPHKGTEGGSGKAFTNTMTGEVEFDAALQGRRKTATGREKTMRSRIIADLAQFIYEEERHDWTVADREAYRQELVAREA